MIQKIFIFTGISFLAFVAPLFKGHAHSGHHHAESVETREPSVAKNDPAQPAADPLVAVNTIYLKEVKPIFEKKCFDCHSSHTRFPWYYPIPGIKYLIDRDIRQAKKHMDMSKDFPFQGHGSPSEDIEDLEDIVKEGDMPPLTYRLMHRGSSLTEDEKLKVQTWIDAAKKIIPKSPQ